MKKILFSIMAVVAMSFASCGNSTTGTTENDSVCADTCGMCSKCGAEDAANVVESLTKALNEGNAEDAEAILSQAEAVVARLVENGKDEEAKAYALKIQEFVANHEDEVKSVISGEATIGSVISSIVNAKATAEEGANAVVSDANAAKVATEAAAAAAKDAAKGAAEATKEAAKQKAAEAAQNAKDQAKEEANKSIDNAANKLKGKLGL